MPAKWNHEIRDLLRSETFMHWYRQYNMLRESINITQVRLTELRSQAAMMVLKADATQHVADDFVYRAGEYEDQALMAQAEFAEFENASFEQVSQFETQRRRATDSWQETDRLEKVVEDERQRLNDLHARAEAARRVGSAEGLSEAERLAARARELEANVRRMAKDAAEARQRMETLASQRDNLWGGVEQFWWRAFRANMARAEYAYQARRVRAEAEEQFARAAVERQQTESLNEQARAAEQQVLALKLEYKAHLERGREAFGCVILDAFMYWPQHEKVTGVWAVPLVDEGRHLNLQVAALQLYQLDRAAGLDGVEPVASGVESSESDERLEAFFKGNPRNALSDHAVWHQI